MFRRILFAQRKARTERLAGFLHLALSFGGFTLRRYHVRYRLKRTQCNVNPRALRWPLVNPDRGTCKYRLTFRRRWDDAKFLSHDRVKLRYHLAGST
jgi:hypothetical protein